MNYMTDLNTLMATNSFGVVGFENLSDDYLDFYIIHFQRHIQNWFLVSYNHLNLCMQEENYLSQRFIYILYTLIKS